MDNFFMTVSKPCDRNIRECCFTVSSSQYDKMIEISSSDFASHEFDYKITDDVLHDFVCTFDKFLNRRLQQIYRASVIDTDQRYQRLKENGLSTKDLI